MYPSNSCGGFLYLRARLHLGLAEMKFSLLVSLVASTQLGVVVAAEQTLAHVGAAVNFGEHAGPLVLRLEIVALFDCV